MNIIFKSIRFKNFLQVGNDFVNFKLNENPFTAIIGKNGSGKSTLLDAITYALFKRPFRKVKLSQLINSTNKKGLLVELAFSIGKDLYIIRRGEKPKIFEIYKNKELIEIDDSTNNYQDFLESNIIRQSYKTFTQINTIGKASYIQFMNLDPSSRRQIIEDLLDTGVYDIMSSLCKEDIKNLKEDIRDIDTKIFVLDSDIKKTGELIKTFEYNKNFRINDLENELKNLQSQLDDLTSKESSLEDFKDLEESLEDIIPSDKIQEFDRRFNNLNKELGSLEYQNREARKVIDNIGNLTTCPTCLQEVSDDHKSLIFNENQKKIEENNLEISSINSKIQKFKDIKNKYESKKSEINSKRNNLIKIQNDIRHINNRIESTNLNIKKVLKEKLPEHLDTSKNKEDLLNLKTINDKNNENLKILNESLSYLNDKGIKSALVNKYIPIINQTINSYLEMMGMFVEFELDSSFNETISAINRENFSYESFSEGQKVRIDLAILLTWRKISQLRNSMNSNLFILDEIADSSLDSDGFQDFMNIIKTAFPNNNVFLISHKTEAIDLFENIIQVETQGNFSYYY